LSERNLAVTGNLLASATVIDAMAAAFRATPELHLADRLMRALAAGKAAGGEVGGNEHSAGLRVGDRDRFALIDLRVDWAEADPIGRLAELWARYRPEMDLYRLRAIDPPAAEARRQE